MTGLIIVIALVVVVVLWYISANNKLVALTNNRENAFADYTSTFSSAQCYKCE